MYKIQTYNAISPTGLALFPGDQYTISEQITDPDAILLRSYKLNDIPLPDSLKAIARAGAGINNIPIEKCNEKGIPVFNTPGANANAVKELVIAAMLLACRNICQGWAYTRTLDGDDKELNLHVEQAKKQFAGFELPGKTLAILGLGAIGVQVANAASALGMKVIGYDPKITIQHAWALSADIERAQSSEAALQHADFVSVHVPLNDHTRNLINADAITKMKNNVIILNFSRGGIINEQAVADSLETGKLHCYVSDFPTLALKSHPRVIMLPHLGASTEEAEENCATMAVNELRAFLEDGTIANSVNFPNAFLSPKEGEGSRIAITNENVPNMVGQISTVLAHANLNIVEMSNQSRANLAYTLIDVHANVGEAVVKALSGIVGVLNVRVISP